MHACLQRSWVQPALLRLQHAMAGRMGEKGLRGGRYSEMYGAPSDEGQAVAHDTCDRIPMQKYVFPRQISRSWRKWPAAGIRFCSSNWFELRILYTRVYICHADRFIAEGWFSNRIYSIRITGERVVAISFKFLVISISFFFFFVLYNKIVIPTILLFRINIASRYFCSIIPINISFNCYYDERDIYNEEKVGPRFWRSLNRIERFLEGISISRPLSIQRSAERKSHVHMFLISQWPQWWISLFSSWFFGPLSQWGTKIAH